MPSRSPGLSTTGSASGRTSRGCRSDDLARSERAAEEASREAIEILEELPPGRELALRVHEPGPPPDAEPRQRRGCSLGPRGRRARRGDRRRRHGGVRAEHDRHVVSDGRRDRERADPPPAEPRLATEHGLHSRVANALRHARHRPRRDVRARRSRSAGRRELVDVRGPSTTWTRRTSRAGSRPSSSTRAGGTKERRWRRQLLGRATSARSAESQRSSRSVACERAAAIRAWPTCWTRRSRSRSQEDTSSALATSTRRAPRPLGSRGTRHAPSRRRAPSTRSRSRSGISGSQASSPTGSGRRALWRTSGLDRRAVRAADRGRRARRGRARGTHGAAPTRPPAHSPNATRRTRSRSAPEFEELGASPAATPCASAPRARSLASRAGPRASTRANPAA